MALRFIAWSGASPSQTWASQVATAERAGLVQCYASRDLTVFTNDLCRTLPLGDNAGILLGHLFTRPPSPALVQSLSQSDARAAVDTAGQSLIDGFWGGYVAFICSRDRQVCLRDPSGTLPCIKLQLHDVTIFASDVETLWDAGLLDPMIDWDCLDVHLRIPDMRTDRTCLNGVAELLAGARWVSDRPLAQSPVWSPWQFVMPSQERDPAEAVRTVVAECVGAWAKAFPTALLGVSGGLDSSVLAACAATASSELNCLTMATDEAEGDERTYARLLTEHLGLPLIEGFHDLSRTRVSQSTSAHLPRPIQTAFGQSERALKFELADQIGAEAFFNGIGGDNVFCHMRSATPILDRLYTEGLTRGVFESLRDICTLTGASVWEVGGQMIRKACRGREYPWQTDHSYLMPPRNNGPLDWVHPWQNSPVWALPGKATHVAMLTRIQGTIDGYPRRGPPLINPLLSQPIMEACLGIPTWAWCAGGRDRSPVRRGFLDILPKALTDRRSKGGPNSFAYAVIDNNKPELRAMLLDGLLVQEGIADREALASALSDAHPLPPTAHMRISTLAEVEAWSRHWMNRRPKVKSP